MSDKYSTLDVIVKELITEQTLPDLKRYPPYLAYAYAFLNGEYPIAQAGGTTLKTKLLDVGPDRMAELPDDYVQFVSVGRICGNYVRNLAYNPKLAPSELLVQPVPGVVGYGDLHVSPASTWPGFGYWGHELLGLGEWDGRGYGWGEFREEFALDTAEGTIRLSTVFEAGGPPLVLQYQSNDLKPGKPTPIHPYWKQALKAWMMWQWYDKAKENPTLARRHQGLYGNERKKAIKRTDTTSYTDITDLIYQNYNAPK